MAAGGRKAVITCAVTGAAHAPDNVAISAKDIAPPKTIWYLLSWRDRVTPMRVNDEVLIESWRAT
ncbi:hypothetical protein [Mesorhizobium sp. WSM2561]|uniref:hypothetical protein n=1 Tax=Mesorhizobium sp. WSM2561 TaxID=1040985 RepID=UPI000482CCED|nr:hypothetical protein [Mesorhizobium sp. WSM2561]